MKIRIAFSYDELAVMYMREKMRKSSFFLARGVASTMAEVVGKAYSKYGFYPRTPNTYKKYEMAGYDFDVEGMIKTRESFNALSDVAAGKHSSKVNTSGESSLSLSPNGMYGEIKGGITVSSDLGISYWMDDAGRPVLFTTVDELVKNSGRIAADSFVKGIKAKRARGVPKDPRWLA